MREEKPALSATWRSDWLLFLQVTSARVWAYDMHGRDRTANVMLPEPAGWKLRTERPHHLPWQ